MNSEQPILTLMVALNCEAKPWVDFYRLKKVSDKPFVRYSNTDVSVEIVITGIGALAMSTAVGWVAGRQRLAGRVWLNLGIAGHLNREVGEIVRAHAFIDSGDLSKHYSPLVAKWSGDSDALMSVNAPTGSYPDAAMVDMEGLAFYRSASIFSSAELIESIKVISDNPGNSVENLNASKITQLMQPHVALVNDLSNRLLGLIQPNQAKPIVLPLIDIRMTHSQKQQLDRLLGKATVLDLHQSVSELDLPNALNIGDVLSRLRTLVDAAAPSIPQAPAVATGSKHG